MEFYMSNKNIIKSNKNIIKKLDRIDPSQIQGAALCQKVKQLKVKHKQGGFTLLELLVVVAILAAIAGTAAIALQDTDARASAAAHVAMMDELDKGIRTYRVLQKNQYPDNFDSIMETTGAIAADGTIATGTAQLGIAAHEDLRVMALNLITAPGEVNAGDTVVERLHDLGITQLRVASTDSSADPDGDLDCSDHEALVASRGNAVVAGNIFLSPAANGCGGSHTLSNASNVMVWAGGTERITGEYTPNDFVPADSASVASTDATAANVGAPIFMAVGIGPSTTLFNKENIGSMTTVPVYRHVSETEYNRFVALFHIANVSGDGTYAPVDQVLLTAIVDGAGDTKEEELGEWDGTRNTI
jgi:prepilin-type N-terminal cleavage/methylation domain-containing protein